VAALGDIAMDSVAVGAAEFVVHVVHFVTPRKHQALTHKHWPPGAMHYQWPLRCINMISCGARISLLLLAN